MNKIASALLAAGSGSLRAVSHRKVGTQTNSFKEVDWVLRACNKTRSRVTSHPEARCAAVNFRLGRLTTQSEMRARPLHYRRETGIRLEATLVIFFSSDR